MKIFLLLLVSLVYANCPLFVEGSGAYTSDKISEQVSSSLVDKGYRLVDRYNDSKFILKLRSADAMVLWKECSFGSKNVMTFIELWNVDGDKLYEYHDKKERMVCGFPIIRKIQVTNKMKQLLTKLPHCHSF